MWENSIKLTKKEKAQLTKEFYQNPKTKGLIPKKENDTNSTKKKQKATFIKPIVFIFGTSIWRNIKLMRDNKKFEKKNKNNVTIASFASYHTRINSLLKPKNGINFFPCLA